MSSATDMSKATQLPPVRTPCIGVCSTGIGDAVCRGCKRFSHEVIDWNGYTQEEKRIVDRRLSAFLSQACAHKCTIEDASLLQWQLDVQQVRYDPSHDAYSWLFQLCEQVPARSKIHRSMALSYILNGQIYHW